MNNSSETAWFRAMPGIFVLLWATGFIGAKYGLPHAEPLSFLALRYVCVIIILLALAMIARAPWPPSRQQVFHALVTGFLIHGVYLGGVFIAIDLGMSAGITALIVGIQPLLTAVLSGALLGERITSRHWFGIALGLAGILLVLYPRLEGSAGTLSAPALVAAGVSLLGITLGTIYQKANALQLDLRTGGVLQYIGATIPTFMAAWFVESFEVTWSLEFIGALAWLVLVLSIGAISLLMLIIRHSDISKVATLFYLVPPVTALMAWFLFSEQLTLVQGGGIVLVVLAVWMAGKKEPAAGNTRVKI